jgi:outer membrane protein OmpA-like peptidoglycan-associated protein/flagellar hook assembly protein FlgD
MKRLLLILCVLSLPIIPAGAEIYRGNEINLVGNSTEALGRGGTGAASSGVEQFYLNPASIADAERIGIGLQFGTLPLPTRFYDGGVSMAVPSSYGVFGASFRYLNFPGRRFDWKEGIDVRVGNARDLTRRLMLGFSLNFLYMEEYGKSYYAGGNIGFIYKFPSTGNRYGFCLMEPKIGLSIHFGYPFGKRPRNSDMNDVTLGYTFKFYSIPHFNLAWYNDFTVLNYREFPVKFGIESGIYDIVTIRGGYVIPHAYNKGSFTAGVGVKLITEGFNGSLNYAIDFYPGMKMTHYLGVNFEIGRLDREPPRTEIKADRDYISPNHDGLKDYVLFRLSVNDWSRIKGWKLQILDSGGQIVKDYSISERDLSDKLTAQEFFKRLFQKRESMVVPERVIWDGTDMKGKIVPDGKYSFSFTAWDALDNIAALKSGAVIIDNTPPEVSLDRGDDLFSPNGDGRKEQYNITQKIKSAPEDEWKAGFRDSSGNVVKKYSWSGATVPSHVIWNGKDDAGSEAPEGLYTYFITCTDKAGNSAGAEIREITLTRKYEIADITIASEYFSFIKDTALNLFPTLSSAYGLVEWRVIIQNAKMKTVREITGETTLPKMIPYDGTDSAGARLEDGVYYANLIASYKSGNTPESYKKMFIIDSVPPKLGVSHTPGLFSPDGDRDNDLLKIQPRVKDDTGIRNWRINIYASSGEVFKTFSGKGSVPEEIIWDGLGDNLDIVESAAEYTIVLEAVDLAGNSGISDPDRLEVDVLVLVTERGLKIRISNIEFPFGTHEIKYRGKVILDRVYQILEKYESYNVLIEGHTDDIGKEEYNLELSERRAKAVNDYLAAKGIRIDRLSFVGMGETVPLYPNDNDENRRRNRRVEFMLIKKGGE